MAKIYTKTGDKGETGLLGGKRVSKGDLRVEAYGDVDELNAVIGVAAGFIDSTDLRAVLWGIQDKLFCVGAALAAPPDYHGTRFVPSIGPAEVKEIEDFIDHYDAQLPKLENFILPSGGPGGSLLHLARTVCRRAERHAVGLSKEEPLDPEIIKYLNRLSDFLFVLARTVNKRGNISEMVWKPR